MRFTGSGIGEWLLDWFIDAKNKPVLFFKKWSAKLYISIMYEGAEERGSGGFAGSSLFQLNVESAQKELETISRSMVLQLLLLKTISRLMVLQLVMSAVLSTKWSKKTPFGAFS